VSEARQITTLAESVTQSPEHYRREKRAHKAALKAAAATG
jgi:hypothetical protein